MIFRNKKALSGIIVAFLLIMISVVLVAVVWVIINNLVGQKIKESSACFGNFDKVTLNDKYTCFNSSLVAIQFSLKLGDISPDGVIVSITSAEQSKTFTINKTSSTITDLTNYNGSTDVSLPQKNSGRTYIYKWSQQDSKDIPDSIEIAPILDGQTCSSSDSLSQIDDCNLIY